MFETILEILLLEAQILAKSSDYKEIDNLIKNTPPEEPFETGRPDVFPSRLLLKNIKSFGITPEEYEQAEEYFSWGTNKYDKKWEAVLEKIVQSSEPSIKDCTLFRGMGVPKGFIDKHVNRLNSGKSTVISMDHPSSWTGFVWVARKFYKHHPGNNVFFQMFVPRGTKGVEPDWGDPAEILLSKEIKMEVTKIRIVYKNVYQFTGKLI